jgi:hypothetical protein
MGSNRVVVVVVPVGMLGALGALAAFLAFGGRGTPPVPLAPRPRSPEPAVSALPSATVVSKAADRGEPYLPCVDSPWVADASFEAPRTSWLLPKFASIDGATSKCGGHALRVQLDAGLGSHSVVRSAYLGPGVEIGKEYELRFFYKHANCKKAEFTFQVGEWENTLRLDGDSDGWVRGAFRFKLTEEPAWIDITAGRIGAYTNYPSPAFDGSVLWVDEIEIVRVS